MEEADEVREELCNDLYITSMGSLHKMYCVTCYMLVTCCMLYTYNIDHVLRRVYDLFYAFCI